jgi:hypothetical protein
MKFASFCLVVFMILMPAGAVAQQGATSPQGPSPAAQALATCISQHATADDNIALMRWMFVGIARHPSVVQLANIPDAQRVEANRAMGALFNRLLLDVCATETHAAFQSDGQAAIEFAFQEFGRRAMTSLMQNPDVNAARSEVGAYVDQQRLTAVAGITR